MKKDMCACCIPQNSARCPRQFPGLSICIMMMDDTEVGSKGKSESQPNDVAKQAEWFGQAKCGEVMLLDDTLASMPAM